MYVYIYIYTSVDLSLSSDGSDVDLGRMWALCKSGHYRGVITIGSLNHLNLSLKSIMTVGTIGG